MRSEGEERRREEKRGEERRREEKRGQLGVIKTGPKSDHSRERRTN